MNFNTLRLAALAETMSLNPLYAVALPSVVEVAAQKMNMSVDRMIRHAEVNEKLRDYFAELCATAINAA
jgi:hypothetical protein